MDIAVCSHFAGFIVTILVFIKALSLCSLTWSGLASMSKEISALTNAVVMVEMRIETRCRVDLVGFVIKT